MVQINPGEYTTLAPCYLSTKDDVCTISPGALKRYSRCTQATHEPLEHLKITTKSKTSVTLPVQTAATTSNNHLPPNHSGIDS